MSNQNRGRDSASAAGTIQVIGADGNAAVTQYVADLGTGGGRYSLQCETGAQTAIAALSNAGTNGISWACRFAPASSTKLALVHRIVGQLDTTVGATVAQRFGITLFRATAFTAIPTSGTAQTTTTPQTKLRVSQPVPEMLISCEDTTSQMTAGTHTLDTQPIFSKTTFQLASGAAVPIPDLIFDIDFGASPLVLAANEGLLAGPAVTQANSLAQIFRMRMVWSEVTTYNQ